MSARKRVADVGFGTMGSQAAWRLAARGAEIVLLAGFSCHGFKLSPAFGDIAADRALNGTIDQPIDFLSTADRTAA